MSRHALLVQTCPAGTRCMAAASVASGVATAPGGCPACRRAVPCAACDAVAGLCGRCYPPAAQPQPEPQAGESCGGVHKVFAPRPDKRAELERCHAAGAEAGQRRVALEQARRRASAAQVAAATTSGPLGGACAPPEDADTLRLRRLEALRLRENVAARGRAQAAAAKEARASEAAAAEREARAQRQRAAVQANAAKAAAEAAAAQQGARRAWAQQAEEAAASAASSSAAAGAARALRLQDAPAARAVAALLRGALAGGALAAGPSQVPHAPGAVELLQACGCALQPGPPPALVLGPGFDAGPLRAALRELAGGGLRELAGGGGGAC